MNWTAAAAALCLSACAGFWGAALLKKRARALQTLVLLLERLELELGFSRAPLPDMLLRLQTEPPFDSFGLLSVCCGRLRAGEPLRDAWLAGTQTLRPVLRDWECVRLRAAGDLLGATDLPGQQKLLLELLAFLRPCREQSLRQSAAGGRLCRVCGLCFGCTLFIMIL
ncbi:MAG: hypothetical protein II621_07330 [Clostridia bacterium]|nr:hypothetical protein [Clostridia bacterium]MBR3094239.1 hypothetical protein [Clostridia bacterium]